MKITQWILCIATAAAAAAALGAFTTARAEAVSEETARIVAENFIRLTVAKEGGWGESGEGRVVSIEPFRGAARDLGWYCRVEPAGYILVGLHTDMMPVRASSTKSTLDPNAAGGLAAFFRVQIERTYQKIERKLGRAIVPGDDLRPFVDRSYRDSWPVLSDPGFDAAPYREGLRGRGAGMDYQEGGAMLRSVWDQNPPYNNDCPDEGCDWSGYGQFNSRVVVGCVATAMAQMLRFHNWPPSGYGSPYDDPYDWPNMADTYVYDGNGWFNDENGLPVTWDQINAVAELSRELGRAVEMDYACDGSGAYVTDCESAFEDHFYIDSGCQVLDRSDYNFDAWYEKYRSEYNANRVVGITIPGHMVVGDGWRIYNIGGVDWRQIHVQYGWNGTHDGWYSPDDIVGEGDEQMVRGVRPDCCLYSNPSGTYTTDGSTWRYFNRDVYTDDVTFEQGHWLQILRPGFLITNTGTTSANKIEFRGGSSGNTRLFMEGDPGGERRMIMIDGTFRINAGGQVAFY